MEDLTGRQDLADLFARRDRASSAVLAGARGAPGPAEASSFLRRASSSARHHCRPGAPPRTTPRPVPHQLARAVPAPATSRPSGRAPHPPAPSPPPPPGPCPEQRPDQRAETVEAVVPGGVQVQENAGAVHQLAEHRTATRPDDRLGIRSFPLSRSVQSQAPPSTLGGQGEAQGEDARREGK